MATKAELTWGKCTITYKVGSKTYTATPQQGSTKLTVTEGTATEAKIEGGETIAVRRDSDSYTLEFKEFVHPNNVNDYKERIDNPEVDATELTVKPSSKDALGITVPIVSMHSSFDFETQNGILMTCKATFVKGDSPLFSLAKIVSPG